MSVTEQKQLEQRFERSALKIENTQGHEIYPCATPFLRVI